MKKPELTKSKAEINKSDSAHLKRGEVKPERAQLCKNEPESKSNGSRANIRDPKLHLLKVKNGDSECEYPCDNIKLSGCKRSEAKGGESKAILPKIDTEGSGLAIDRGDSRKPNLVQSSTKSVNAS